MLALKKINLKGDDIMKIVVAINYRYAIVTYSIYSTNIIL